MFTDAIECIVRAHKTFVKLQSKTLQGSQFYTKSKAETVEDTMSKTKVETFDKQVLIYSIRPLATVTEHAAHY